MQTLLAEVILIARQAGKLILEAIVENDWHVQQKADNTPVTSIDQLASEFICDQLSQLCPSVLIVSEESMPETLIPSDSYWLVDPLDGTRGFIDGSSEYSINISLIESGLPVLGVLYAPMFDDLYYATNKTPAYREFKARQPSQLQLKSTPAPWRLTCSRYFPLNKRFTGFESVCLPYTLRLNSALKFAAVASAQAHIYLRLGPTSQWDSAAGQCILQQAGGIVVDLSGEKLHYTLGQSLINPAFLAVSHESLVEQCLSLYEQWRNVSNENS